MHPDYTYSQSSQVSPSPGTTPLPKRKDKKAQFVSLLEQNKIRRQMYFCQKHNLLVF